MAWKLIVILDRKTNDSIIVTLKNKDSLIVDREARILAFLDVKNIQIAIPLERVHLYTLEEIN